MKLDESAFTTAFRDQALLITDLPPGRPRDIATPLLPGGCGALQTRDELAALFAALVVEFGTGEPTLTIADDLGAVTPGGEMVAAYRATALDVDGFFAAPLWQVHVTQFGRLELGPDKKQAVQAPPEARLTVAAIDPDDQRHIAPSTGALYVGRDFSLENTGNRTLAEPKSSWRARLEADLLGLRRLHLKSMVNDASMIREAIAWAAFAEARIRASRRTYVRYAMDAVYRGLYSLTEDVDSRYVRAKFGANDRGNLYKGSCGDLGCASLEHRGPDGVAYRPDPHSTDPTYELRTNEDDAAANTFDDLAAFVTALHDGPFDTSAYRDRMEDVFDVRGFLRWAGVTSLLGSWDTYYGTPANYFLYNSGHADDPDAFMTRPFFTFLPWDYDNILGITYASTQQAYGHADWAGADILDWPRSRRPDGTARLPLLVNLLAHPDFRQYYLDHVAHLLDTTFDPAVVATNAADAWGVARRSAYLEADFPTSRPFTGRRWVNHDVYRHVERGETLRAQFSPDDRRTLQGIVEFATTRHDAARAQLTALGHVPVTTDFPGAPEPVPE